MTILSTLVFKTLYRKVTPNHVLLPILDPISLQGFADRIQIPQEHKRKTARM